MKRSGNLKSSFGSLPESHYVPDILRPNLKVVFCGTALGFKSAQLKAYYAHPGNFFWRTLYQVQLTPKLIDASNYHLVSQYGIGLTDLCKNAYGNDTQLPQGSFDVEALKGKIRRFKPQILAFTSKTSAGAFMGLPTWKLHYGIQENAFHKTSLFVLPSPSGQARMFWDPAPWRDLAKMVGTHYD